MLKKNAADTWKLMDFTLYMFTLLTLLGANNTHTHTQKSQDRYWYPITSIWPVIYTDFEKAYKAPIKGDFSPVKNRRSSLCPWSTVLKVTVVTVTEDWGVVGESTWWSPNIYQPNKLLFLPMDRWRSCPVTLTEYSPGENFCTDFVWLLLRFKYYWSVSFWFIWPW